MIEPLSISVSTTGKPYKSISTLKWNDIPGFSILTGKNGSGKTQLLELLAYHYSGALPYPPSDAPLPVTIDSQGATYAADEIAYVPSGGKFSGGVATSLASMPNVRDQHLQIARDARSHRYQIDGAIKAERVTKRLAGRSPHRMTPEMLIDAFPDDFEFAIGDIDVTEGLTHLFMAHRLKLLEALERKTPGIDRQGNALGPSPWVVVNEALKVAGFPYEVISPEETPLMEQYELKLRDKVNAVVIPALHLSSGEKVLFQLVLWLFTAGKGGLFPKLLLLDEPDAHLHPSMTTQFLDVISEVLVNQYHVRVIMTSHSPSTVAMAEDGSVFQMERGGDQVVKVDRRSDIISVLTAGLVTVSRSTKYCFVEDEDDVKFYNTIYEILIDEGPSRDPMALRPSPTMVFIPASIGEGSSKISGGSTVVAKWVNKLDGDPLDGMFFGIVDNDNGATPTDRILTIGRYSFENYLLDPIVLFALLLENGTAPTIPGVAISSGDEHLLRLQEAAALQAIVDGICAAVESSEGSLKGQLSTTVSYTSGAVIQMPEWVVKKRGHDLLPIVQKALGGPQVINPPRLRKALRRCRVIPKELAVLLADIQAK